MSNLRPPTLPTRDFSALYEDLGLISQTMFSEVRRVRDRVLDRAMVAKLLAEDACAEETTRMRFVLEAQVTAQLQHAGIVPVHELAQTPAGRPYFTMKEIEGRTLTQLVRSVHAASSADAFGHTADGWSFRRLIDAVRRASDAVAFAHSRGVLHRDLKPDNIMASEYGEVSVVDWGLAKVGAVNLPTPGSAREVGPELTQAGEISGTAQYMAPEQAMLKTEKVKPPTDVYGLGATLLMVLTGEPPYTGASWEEVWRQVLRGPPKPIGQRASTHRIPAELVRICERAMAREPADRYPDAGAFRDVIAAWLDGVHRRDQALERVREADKRAAEAASQQAESARVRAEANAALEKIPVSASTEHKIAAWNLEDQANEHARLAELNDVENLRLLYEALSLVPELPEARQRMAQRYRARHEDAELRRASNEATRFEALLRQFDTGAHAGYLAGKASFSLVTDPVGAKATLYEIVEVKRRFVPQLRRDLGLTPLHDVEIHAGSWLVELEHPGHARVRYPIFVRREDRWDGVPPGQSAPLPVRLPREGELEPNDIYVPAGWTILGHPTPVSGLSTRPRRRAWLDAFVIRRFPVTYGEYAAYLSQLHRAGHAAEAARLNVLSQPGDSTVDAKGVPALTLDADGAYVVGRDADGDLMLPDHPVGRLDFRRAHAYTRWLATHTGLPWRLPRADEWEKAARGVDGRNLPWGDYLEPSWFAHREYRQDGLRPFVRPVDSCPVDESIYGVRGMAGNAADFCDDYFDCAPIVSSAADAYAVWTPYRMRVRRGGAFNLRMTSGYTFGHEAVGEFYANDGISFRVCRTF